MDKKEFYEAMKSGCVVSVWHGMPYHCYGVYIDDIVVDEVPDGWYSYAVLVNKFNEAVAVSSDLTDVHMKGTLITTAPVTFVQRTNWKLLSGPKAFRPSKAKVVIGSEVFEVYKDAYSRLNETGFIPWTFEKN